jgi:hypothetical protein
MPTPVVKPDDLKPGDFYEDCAFHPCLCVNVDCSGGDIEIWGVSLIDGSYPRSCGVPGCAVVKLTLEEALQWRFFGAPDYPDGELPPYVAVTGNPPSWIKPPA